MPHESWRALGLALGAEALGTALLVGLGCASLVAGHALTHPALAFGAAVGWLAAALGGTSGAHLNPAVSLCAALAGRLGPRRAAGYVLAQCAGALVGFWALVALGVLADGQGLPRVAPRLAPGAAVALEAALTGALAAHCLALWAQHDARRPDRTAPLALGFTVAGLVYSGGPLTGASINPARSLAPALVYGDWTHQWVYWVGPLAGAALAALLARAGALLVPPPRAAAPPPAEQLPLADKHETC